MVERPHFPEVFEQIKAPVEDSSISYSLLTTRPTQLKKQSISQDRINDYFPIFPLLLKVVVKIIKRIKGIEILILCKFSFQIVAFLLLF